VVVNTCVTMGFGARACTPSRRWRPCRRRVTTHSQPVHGTVSAWCLVEELQQTLLRSNYRYISTHLESARHNSRHLGRIPPRSAFRDDRAFPAALRGPVDRSHGRHVLIAVACRLRLS